MAVKYLQPTVKRPDWIDGYPVRLRGKTYLVPPLSFRQLRELEPDLAITRGDKEATAEEMRAAVAKIAHAAITVHYHKLTLAQVEDMLDGATSRKVMMAILHGSGFDLVEVPDEGEAPAGE